MNCYHSLYTLIIIFLAQVTTSAQEAPTFLYNNQRTGQTDSIGPQETSLLWTFRTGNSIASSPVLAEDGTIYLASTDGNMYALDKQGQLLWSFSADDAIFGTPAIAPDGSIRFGTLNGTFYAVNVDGNEMWNLRVSNEADTRMIASPVVDSNGQSYIGSWDNSFYAITNEGTTRWRSRLSGLLSSSPALDENGNAYIATLDNQNLLVERYSPNSSSARWTFTENLRHNRNRVISSPSIDSSRNQLYIGANAKDEGLIAAVDITHGRLLWKTSLNKGVFSTPAISKDGTVYAGCLDGNLYALNPQNGDILWTFDADGLMIMGSASIDGNGIVYVGDTNGILYAVSPAGKEIWRFQAQSNIRSAPVIAPDGMLYFTSYDSTLYAIAEPTEIKNWLLLN
jgi:outer membrane protein assembly factor BamB